MRDLILLVVGAVLGVIVTECYAPVKTRYVAMRSARDLSSSTVRDDPRRHAKNIIAFFDSAGRSPQLYKTVTTRDDHILPILPDTSDRFVGPLVHDSDWPLLVSRVPRLELHVDDRVIESAKRRGVELWDGTILHATGWDPTAASLSVARCNYYSYVSFGERVLRESDSASGREPYLQATTDLCRALASEHGPTVVAAATTCIFESVDGSVTAVHQRSASVVNARGMHAMTPVHGIEPNFAGTETSRYGVVVYNVLKEIAEEFFGVDEIRFNNDRPHGSHPDWIFTTPVGEALVNALHAGTLKLFCDGACIDLTDGGLILAVSAHFLDPAFLERLKLQAPGSNEADWVDGRRFEFLGLQSLAMESLMNVNRMISSSVFSVDRARHRFAPPP